MALEFAKYQITSPYGKQRKTGTHKGIDFGTPLNTPIQTPVSGRVERVETLQGSYGKNVRIVDDEGNIHIFAHLNSFANIKPGQKIEAGTLIGYSGSTGKSTGPHLHYEVRRGNDYNNQIDPNIYISNFGKSATKTTTGKEIDKQSLSMDFPRTQPVSEFKFEFKPARARQVSFKPLGTTSKPRMLGNIDTREEERLADIKATQEKIQATLGAIKPIPNTIEDFDVTVSIPKQPTWHEQRRAQIKAETQPFELKLESGENFGMITPEGFKALKDDTVDEYVKNAPDWEKETIKKYQDYAYNKPFEIEIPFRKKATPVTINDFKDSFEVKDGKLVKKPPKYNISTPEGKKQAIEDWKKAQEGQKVTLSKKQMDEIFAKVRSDIENNTDTFKPANEDEKVFAEFYKWNVYPYEDIEPKKANLWDMTIGAIIKGWKQSQLSREAAELATPGKEPTKQQENYILKKQKELNKEFNYTPNVLTDTLELLGQQAWLYIRPEAAKYHSAGTQIAATTGGVALASLGSVLPGLGTVTGAAVGTVLGTITGIGLSFALASTTGIKQLEAGNSYLENRQQGLNHKTAAISGQSVGIINSAIEFAQFRTLTKGLNLIKKAGSNVVKKVMGEFGEQATKKVLSNAVARGVINIGKEWLKSTAKEAGEEMLQEGVAIAASNLARAMNGLPLDSFSDINQRIIDTGVSSFLTFGLMGAPSTILGTRSAIGEAKNITKSVDMLNGVSQILPPDVRPKALDVKATQADVIEQYDTINNLLKTPEVQQRIIAGNNIVTLKNSREQAISDIAQYQNEIKKAKADKNITAEQKQDLINGYSSQIKALHYFIKDTTQEIKELTAIKDKTATQDIIDKYNNIEPFATFEALAPTHIDLATGINNGFGLVRAEKLPDGQYKISTIGGRTFIKSEAEINARYTPIKGDKEVEQVLQGHLTKRIQDTGMVEEAEIMKTPMPESMADEKASDSIKRLDTLLIDYGVRDAERRNILNILQRHEKGFKNANISLNTLVNIVDSLSKGTENELKNIGQFKNDGKVFEIALNLLAKKDTPITADIIKGFADVWVDLYSSKAGYRSIVKYLESIGKDSSKESIAQYLTEYAISKTIDGEINEQITHRSLFGRMVREFKAWVQKFINNIAEVKKAIWGEPTGEFKRQAEAFAKGDWSVVFKTTPTQEKQAQKSVKDTQATKDMPMTDKAVKTQNIKQESAIQSESDKPIEKQTQELTTKRIEKDVAENATSDKEEAGIKPTIFIPETKGQTAIVFSVSSEDRRISSQKEAEIRLIKDIAANTTKAEVNRVVFEDFDDKINGYYDRNTKTIYINPNVDKPLIITAGHEFFHSLRAGDKAKLIDFFRSNLAEDTKEFQAYKKERMEAYQKLFDKRYEEGKDKTRRIFTEHDFWQEFSAENCETLFSNREYVNKLAKRHRNIVQKFIDFVRDLWRRIIGYDKYTTSEATRAAQLTAKQLAQAEAMLAEALGIETALDKKVEIQQKTVTESAVDDIGYGDLDIAKTIILSDYKNDTFNFSIDTDTETLTPERIAQIYKTYEQNHVGILKPSKKELWGERFEWVKNVLTRTFEEIPESGAEGTFYAEFRKTMIQWKALPSLASHKTIDNINKMTEGLSPKEFKTFSKLVYFLDLQEETEIQKKKGYKEILLPNNITPAEVDAVIEDIQKNNLTPKVKKAIAKRKKVWDNLKKQYIRANQHIGFDVENRFLRENYYRHQVIEYMDQDKRGLQKRDATINTGRGWLKQRRGSTLAINTDFLAVEHQALLQMQYDTYIAEYLGKIKDLYDIKPQLKIEAHELNKQRINEIIEEESKGEFVQKGNRLVPDSETYDELQFFNQRIAMGFSNLIEMAQDGLLSDFDGVYSDVVNELKRNSLNSTNLYKYISTLAGMEAETKADNEAIKYARTVLKYTAQKKSFIKEKLGDKYETWKTLAEKREGYTIHQPRRGNYFYTKEVIAEDVFNKVAQDLINALADGEVGVDESFKEVFSEHSETIKLIGAAFEEWVLPERIVKTMDKVANPKNLHWASNLIRDIQNMWKGWVTSVNIWRTAKFFIRNLTGDLDAAIAGSPKITKHTKRALSEVYDAMRHNKYSPEMAEWIERGGYTSMIFANEIDTKTQDEIFGHLKEKSAKGILLDKVNIFGKYYTKVQDLHNFREAILRYAAYLHYKNEIINNNGVVKDYVASNKYIVDGLQSIEDKAYQLSKDLLGAYDEVTVFGQFLRQYVVPFYSFKETNMRRYYRLFKNIIMSNVSLPEKTLKLLLKAILVNWMPLLLLFWNRVLKRDDDDKLPPSVREIPHITFCSWGDKVYAFTRIGSFSDLLEWVGLEDYKWTKDDLWAPINNVYSMLTPLYKTPFELMFGYTAYPDLSKPRQIRDRAEYFFNTLGVVNEYKAITGKPSKGYLESLDTLLIYKYDYKESAYFEVLDLRRKFNKNDDIVVFNKSKKSQALYNMKLAIRYKDKKAALKYLDKYFTYGGTGRGIADSFNTMNPMYGFTTAKTIKEGKKFINSLNENEKIKLKIAIDHYEKELKLPSNIASILRKKSMTNESARKIMKDYIEKSIK